MSDTPRKSCAPETTQRVAILSCVPRLLLARGHDPDDVLQPLRIGAGSLANPDATIPYALAGAILAICASRTQIPHFGMLVGMQGDYRSLGRLGDLMACAPTLLDALNDFVSFQQANSRGAVVYLHRHTDSVFLGYGIYDASTVAHEQLYQLVVTLGLRIVRTLTAGRVAPEEVWLTQRRPEDAAPYRAEFRCPILFDQPATGLVLARSAMSIPLPGRDGRRHDGLRATVASLMPQGRTYWSNRVRHVLRPLILLGRPTTAHVASQLDLTARSLSRRLEREGTTVGQLLDDVRYSSARELLAVTRLSIGDIANALSYGQSSAFVTAFKRWSGTTPESWRRSEVRGQTP